MSEEANMNALGEISAPMPEGTTAPEQTADNSLELTVNDLQLLRQMLSVGTVFNKLDTFLTAVAEQQKQGDANGS
jgi:hypothetical protein